MFPKSSGFYSQKQSVFGISMRWLASGIKKLETLSEFIQNYKTKGLFKLLALYRDEFFHWMGRFVACRSKQFGCSSSVKSRRVVVEVQICYSNTFMQMMEREKPVVRLPRFLDGETLRALPQGSQRDNSISTWHLERMPSRASNR